MMRIIIFFLMITFLGLQYKLWFSEGSVFEWVGLEKKLAHQEAVNQELLARNKALEVDILELKSGDQALEEQARYELGMIKKGEEYYQFVE